MWTQLKLQLSFQLFQWLEWGTEKPSHQMPDMLRRPLPMDGCVSNRLEQSYFCG